jgi:glycosyltransferase involved in cell wall biosynthesis
MRLLLLTPSLGAGGAERQHSILLPALRAAGVDARVIALDSGGPFVAPLQAAGVPLEVLGMRHQLDLGRLVSSPLVRGFAPDVVMSRGVSGLYVGEGLARWRRAAHVFNDHRGLGVPLSRRREAMIAALARRLTGVIAVSPDQVGTWLGLGVAPERVTVIPNGVELGADAPPRDEARRALGIPPAAIVALLVASLKPLKRVPDFVAAVRSARRVQPNLLGLIAGDGPLAAQVRASAEGDPAIRMLGFRNDVARLLAAADMLVLTSQYEAAPMAVLEAMAAGLPVVATRVGAVPELVADGESGVLFAPGDTAALREALVRLAGDPPGRARLGSAGRRRCAERWAAEAMTARYLQTLMRWAGMAEGADVGSGVAADFGTSVAAGGSGVAADVGTGVAAGSGSATAV